MYLSNIAVTYTSGGTTSVATTTTIDATGITNTDVYTSTAAGSLTATVTETESGNAVSGATVTWTSSDEGVATIANDGTVTLVAAGTTTITASYTGVSGEFGASYATYDLTVTSSAPYVQPTTVEIVPNYDFWGKTETFSGNTYSELSGEKDNVVLEWTKGSGSTYANQNAMRFYKANTLTFAAPTGYEIKSIVLTSSTTNTTSEDLTFSPEGYANGTWTGTSATVTMSRPSDGASYYTINKFTITLDAIGNTPSFTVTEPDELAFDAQEGSFNFTLNNPVEGGSCSIEENVEWIEQPTITDNPTGGYTVNFYAIFNNATAARSATVTLVYTYGDNLTVTQDVTITQAGNPYVIDNIGNITEDNTSYIVKGTVVATNSRGFIIGDGTGYVYTYLNAIPTYAIGDMVKISGTTTKYGVLIQFNNQASITEAEDSEYDDNPTYVVINQVPDYSDNQLSTYLQFEGKLTKTTSGNNTYYNIAVGNSAIRISYPTTDQVSDLETLLNKIVRVNGFYTGNSGEVFTVMMKSIEEVFIPTLTVSPTLLDVSAAEHEGVITVTCENMGTDLDIFVWTCDAEGLSYVEYDWFSTVVNSEGNVEYEIGANSGEARTAYMKILVGDQVAHEVYYSEIITITQAEYVEPVFGGLLVFGSATGSTRINVAEVTANDSHGNTWTITTAGTNSFTQNNAYSQVGSSAQPATSITFTATLPRKVHIKSFSADFGGFSGTSGNISLKVGDTEVGTGSLNGIEDVSVVNTTAAIGNVLTVTVTNIGKGVKCFSLSYEFDEVLSVAGYGEGTGNWYLIASPVLSVTPSAANGFITDPANTYDLYYFDQTGGENGKVWKNYKQNTFNIVSGTGYLYANKNNVDLVFEGVPYVGNGTVTLTMAASGRFSSVNLVGNPYNVVATASKSFYKMKSDGSGIEASSDFTVNPMEGIFVLADSDGETMTFTPASQNAPAPNNQIVVNVAGSSRGSASDRAIVRFGESSTLPKLRIFESGTEVYIPQNGKDYAIVSAEAQGELPLNFRASENGQYTLAVNTEGLNMNSLRLIDNMTGNDIDLLATSTGSVATYTFTGKPGDYESRFRLVFSANSTSDGDDETFAFVSNGNIIINGEGTLQVIDMTGRVMVCRDASNASAISTTGMVPGVYVLQLINGNDVKTQKIVVE